jgi:hypothetical protein
VIYEAGSSEITIISLAPFSEKILLTATVVGDNSRQAECIIDYLAGVRFFDLDLVSYLPNFSGSDSLETCYIPILEFGNFTYGSDDLLLYYHPTLIGGGQITDDVFNYYSYVSFPSGATKVAFYSHRLTFLIGFDNEGTLTGEFSLSNIRLSLSAEFLALANGSKYNLDIASYTKNITIDDSLSSIMEFDDSENGSVILDDPGSSDDNTVGYVLFNELRSFDFQFDTALFLEIFGCNRLENTERYDTLMELWEETYPDDSEYPLMPIFSLSFDIVSEYGTVASGVEGHFWTDFFDPPYVVNPV